MRDRYRAAAELLHRVVTDPQVKLEYGSRRRQQLRDAVARGERPDDYRLAWLDEAARRTAGLLREMAAEFDRGHPHDRCSVNDLLDVLTTVTERFRAATRRLRGSG